MKNIIDTWARVKIRQKFEWGTLDCRWLLAEFLQIQALWEMPKEVKELRGSYNNEIGAYKVEKRMPKPVIDYIFDCGYKEIDDVEAKRGDLVKITDDYAFDVYLPVIYNQVVLVGDPKTNKITQQNVYDLDREYTILRRGEVHCHQS